LTDDEKRSPSLLVSGGHPGEVEASVVADQIPGLGHGLDKTFLVRETVQELIE
jgi:hypothetical protein